MSNGTLYIVASPIGNLEDMTFRAVRVLKESSFIICEDTRQSRKLLNHYGITDKKVYSFHSHSGGNSLSFFIDKIISEGQAAYLTDCGTPCVSDPGSKLVSASRTKDIKVIPVPGASALTAAASVTGFAGKELYFAGFLSKKPGKRINELNRTKNISATIIIYESPHRIRKLLEALSLVFPEKDIMIGREISKIHEELLRGKASELINTKFTEKGEFVIAVDNNDASTPEEFEDFTR